MIMLKTGVKKLLNSHLLIKSLIKQKNNSDNRLYFVSVDPKKITHLSLIPENSPGLTGPNAFFGNYTGLFDRFKTAFNNHFMYITAQAMLAGDDWEKTPYYEKLLKYKSHENAIKHLDKLNRIFNSISINGYLSQYELNNLSKSINIAGIKVPVHETLIAMDRHGQFFRLKGGRHRLAVAQLLQVKEIPAILSLVHEKAIHKLPVKRRTLTGNPEDFRPFK